MPNYKIYEASSKETEERVAIKRVVALSTYAGRPVRGVAKCDPRDEYSFPFGKALAIARCDERIADKREKNAKNKLAMAARALEEAQSRFNKMTAYYEDAVQRHAEANEAITELLNTTP